MTKILPVWLVLFISLVTACTTTTSSDNAKIEPAEIIETNSKLEDLNYFHAMLEENHKNFYANISKEDFIEEKNKIAKKTATMSDAEFYFSLKYLLSLVGDAHTNVYPNVANFSTDYLEQLGFAFKKFGDDWHLLLLEKANEQYLGDIVVSINDMSIEEVFEKTKTIMSFDNETRAEGQFSNTINTKQALEYLEIIKPDETVVLQIKDKDGKIHDIELNPLTTQDMATVGLARLQPFSFSQTTPSEIYSTLELDETTYFIQYNSCMESPNLPMKDFVSMVQEDLTNKDYQDIIIDLRYNGGGDSRIFWPMITMLQTLQNEKSFTIYTLIGSNTFSSAINNTIDIENQLDNTTVGTATGGSVNHYGELQSFTLKNSPLLVYYSTKYFELIQDHGINSLYPDIEVRQTFDNYMNGIDTEIEAIKSLNH